MNKNQYISLLKIICSTVLFVTAMVFNYAVPLLSSYSLYLFIASAIIVGFSVLIDAFNGVIHGHMLDENFLMSLGSVCAFILGEYPEGAVILLLYQIGELFQSVAVGKSRNSISELMNICPDEARLENGEIVDPFDVSIGDIILVEPGEKIPLDGILVNGTTSLDTTSLTGEAIPRSIDVGDECISGCINISSPIKIKVTKEFSESTVSKILELVENASSKKAKAEHFVRRFAKVYTPIVVLSAIFVGLLPPLVFKADLSTWLLRAVMFVVISCPCALVVSVPLSFFGALGAASKAGILVKGSNYLEALSDLGTVIFDKTGTLTKGSFTISKVIPVEGVTKDELLAKAAILESHSDHPIAAAIKKSASSPVPYENLIFENIPGHGIKAESENSLMLAGNRELLKKYGFEGLPTNDSMTCVHVVDQKYIGYILLDDEIKSEAEVALKSLYKNGIKKTVMLTGDKEAAAARVAKALSIDDWHSELLPAEKVEITERIIQSSSHKVAFVGDGINDAPVLAASDIGIAMGALGSDAAIEAADIVIMNDDIRLISTAVKISKKAVRICKQNITFSLVIKFIQLILSLVGLGTIWMAVFADVGVLILAIANSMRTLKK